MRKLLVANRGEIARRILRTAHGMGINTVAVYSDADRAAGFVQEADEAVCIGGPPPVDSYLRIDRILAAAAAAGADAVHPGYGFLAENAGFARKVIAAGLTWVGPPPDAIEVMGSKVAARRAMEEAGVAVVPGAELDAGSDAGAAAAALGYPVLVKASAGGGGKGMRVVADPQHLDEALAAARREAAGAFGDATIFLEKYLEGPRHIEVQVMGDTDGTVYSLFERECSIQRRHQKIVEEAPSPAVDPERRAALGAAACAAAEAVGYRGAGTVEFIVDAAGDFHFLEMNTRLQVEHPVTEMVTGLDLVRLQILVARGESIAAEVAGAGLDGHAIEVRLYAEDPTNSFLPTTGTIHRFHVDDWPGIRVDASVADGEDVTIHYDPMLAKVIAWGSRRDEAAARLASVLERARLHGIRTNRELLIRVLRHSEFLSGDYDTHFLDRHDPAELGRPLTPAEAEPIHALAAALAAQAVNRTVAPVLGPAPSGWRNNPSQLQQVSYLSDRGEPFAVGYRFDRGGVLAEVNGVPVEVDVVACRPDSVELITGGVERSFAVDRYGAEHYVDSPLGASRFVEQPRFPTVEETEDPGSLRSPMPGRVVAVLVTAGDRVSSGDALLVVEAMKMEHTIRAPGDGVVTAVRVGEDDQVDGGQVLAVVEAGEGE